MCVPPIQDVSFNLVQFFPEKAARFKIQEAPIASSSESGRRGEKERGNVRSASHSLLTESCMTSSLSPFFQLATSPEKPCKILSHHTVVTSSVLCCVVLCYFVMVCLPVVDHFHVAVLLDPELPHNYVVNAARRICPCVGFVVAADKTTAHMVSF